MTKATETEAAPQTIEVAIPTDPAQARFLFIMAGDSATAKAKLAEIASEHKALAKQASELRMMHDSLLANRKAMRGDLADVAPLRQPKGSGGDATDD